MGVNVILFKNLFDPVKSFILNDVRLNLLLFHDFSQIRLINILFEHL